MKKLVGEFSGDYRVMRVIFSTSSPLETLQSLHTKISYKTFISYLEYLDAKQTLDEDISERNKQKMLEQQNTGRNSRR